MQEKGLSHPEMLGWRNTRRASGSTLPETKIAPENRPLEKDIPIENHHV